MSQSLKTYALGLIGRGISATRSPMLHETEAAALGLTATYRVFDFDAIGWSNAGLADMLNLMRDAGFAGTNVTHPFKQSVLPHCDELSDDARALGAVNTIVFRDGKIYGENTDWIGFQWLVECAFGSVAGQRIAQIGAGGAGSATAYALGRMGAGEVALFDPDASRSAELAERLSPLFPKTKFTVAQGAEWAIVDATGVVQATPIGMAAHPGVPFDPALMQACQWLADIIYFPAETELLTAARGQGQRVENGTRMVAGQAAAALALFTGAKPDFTRMMDSLSAPTNAQAAA